MSFTRLFAIVALTGLIALAALTLRGGVTTLAASESVNTTVSGNLAEGIIKLHRRQELAAGSSEAAHGVAARWAALDEAYRERYGVIGGSGQNQLAQVRAATAQLHQIPAAEAAGYHLVPGLDYCFDDPGVGGMGVHYIKTSSLDLNLDPLQPEAMVYAVGPNGQLQLGAVEYIVPAEEWDGAGNTQPPSLMGNTLMKNAGLGVYALHAWIWLENPSGMIADWNPKVSCP